MTTCSFCGAGHPDNADVSPPCVKPEHYWQRDDASNANTAKTTHVCANCGLQRKCLVWYASDNASCSDDMSRSVLDFHRKQKIKYEFETRKVTGNPTLKITDKLIRTFLMLGHSRDVTRDSENCMKRSTYVP